MEATPSTVDPLLRYHGEKWHTPQGHLIREVIFGANDGLVTMIGFVAGVTGALSDSRPIILASIAMIVAGSISMGIGAYLSSKAQTDFFDHEIERERYEIVNMREHEVQEVRDYYTEMGLPADVAETIVKHVTSDEKLFLRFMMHEELGIFEKEDSRPFLEGLTVAGAFFVAAWVPVIPYFFTNHLSIAVTYAIAFSISFLIAMGIAKAKITNTLWWKSSFEMAGLGIIAMVIGYLGSLIVSHFIPS